MLAASITLHRSPSGPGLINRWSDRHEKPRFPGQQADVQHVFIKDRRLHVGVGDRTGAHLLGLLDRELGGDVIAVDLLRGGLRDLPILAELALQVAACGCQGRKTGLQGEREKKASFRSGRGAWRKGRRRRGCNTSRPCFSRTLHAPRFPFGTRHCLGQRSHRISPPSRGVKLGGEFCFDKALYRSLCLSGSREAEKRSRRKGTETVAAKPQEVPLRQERIPAMCAVCELSLFVHGVLLLPCVSEGKAYFQNSKMVRKSQGEKFTWRINAVQLRSELLILGWIPLDVSISLYPFRNQVYRKVAENAKVVFFCFPVRGRKAKSLSLQI